MCGVALRMILQKGSGTPEKAYRTDISMLPACRRLKAETFCQPNGVLSVIEENRPVPFAMRRCFFLYDLKPGDVRGRHAALNEQCVFLLSGACSVFVHDGKTETVYRLREPMEGLYIPSSFWREIRDCTDNCMLAVFSDSPYDPAAYIRDFDVFVQTMAKKAGTESEAAT